MRTVDRSIILHMSVTGTHSLREVSLAVSGQDCNQWSAR